MERIGEGFAWRFTEGSRLLIEEVGTSLTVGDPQAVLDLVEEGVEWPEGERGMGER